MKKIHRGRLFFLKFEILRRNNLTKYVIFKLFSVFQYVLYKVVYIMILVYFLTNIIHLALWRFLIVFHHTLLHCFKNIYNNTLK